MGTTDDLKALTEFFASIPSGLEPLTNWKIWVAVLLYIAANLAFLVTARLLTGGSGTTSARVAAGCLLHTFGGFLWQGVLIAVFVAVFFPTLLGIDQLTAPSLLAALLPDIIKAGLIAAATSLVVGLIPVYGDFYVGNPGMQTFVQGTIAFNLLIGGRSGLEGLLIGSRSGLEMSIDRPIPPTAFPDGWQILGYAVIAGVVMLFLARVVALASTWVADKRDSIEDVYLVSLVVAPGTQLLAGITVLFMYVAYIRHAAFGL